MTEKHFLFIALAYAAAALVLGGVTLQSFLAFRDAQRRLEAAEKDSL